MPEAPACGHTWHDGPGCPTWRGQPDAFRILCIHRVTIIDKGILGMLMPNGGYTAVITLEDYERLNRGLLELRADYVRTANR